jgi:hypothetical protein
LAASDILELVTDTDGCPEAQPAALRAILPDYVECNVDVYRLELGVDQYYFLPDCVLMRIGGKYSSSSYRKVTLSINNMGGDFTTTVTEYHWAHARVDGGPDRRHKRNYQIPVSRPVTRRISDYGVLSVRIDRDDIILLTTAPQSLTVLTVAFNNWLSRKT